MSNHETYKRSSPYYQSILAARGRWLDGGDVRTILERHSASAADFCDEVQPKVVGGSVVYDAADVLAWLGY